MVLAIGRSFLSSAHYFAFETVPDTASSVAQRALDAVSYVHPISQKRVFVVIPSSVDIFLGRSGVSGTWYEKPDMLQKVRSIGTFLVDKGDLKGFQGFKWEFFISNSTSVNGYCLPGGKIILTRGLITAFHDDLQRTKTTENKYSMIETTMEEKIAAVLSHEIIHAVSRHTMQEWQFVFIFAALMSLIAEPLMLAFDSVLSVLDSLFPLFMLILEVLLFFFIGITLSDPDWIREVLFAKHSQAQEFEADRWGMHLLEKACTNADLNALRDLNLNKDSAKAVIWISEFFKEHTSSTQKATHWAEKLADFFSWLYSYLFSSHPDNTRRITASWKTWREILRDRVPT